MSFASTTLSVTQAAGNRPFLSALLFRALFAALPHSSSAQSPHPNILFIMSDDRDQFAPPVTSERGPLSPREPWERNSRTKLSALLCPGS